MRLAHHHARLVGELTNTLITYEGVHRLGRSDARRLHAQFSDWMRAFGFGPEPTESLLMLDLRDDDDAGLNAAFDELARDYGRYPKKIQGVNVTDRRELRAFLWQLSQDNLDAAFDRVASLRSRGGLLEIRTGVKLIWKFRLREPETGDLLPGQDALPRLEDFPGGRGDSSSVVVNLAHASSASLWFVLPFAEPDAAFNHYVARMQAALPARLSPRGWRRWTLARSGWRSKKLNVEPSIAVSQ